MRRAALAVLALLALAGCGGAPEVDYTPNGSAYENAATSAAQPSSQPPTDRERYIDVLGTLITSDLTEAELLQIGDTVCSIARVMTRDAVVQTVTDRSTRGNVPAAEILVDTASQELCPTTTFATAPPTPTGPRTVFSTGTYEVGVDILPGRYRSPGGSGCYWARLDDSQEIIDNNLSDGPTVFDVEESDEFVELNRCTWTLSE